MKLQKGQLEVLRESKAKGELEKKPVPLNEKENAPQKKKSLQKVVQDINISDDDSTEEKDSAVYIEMKGLEKCVQIGRENRADFKIVAKANLGKAPTEHRTNEAIKGSPTDVQIYSNHAVWYTKLMSFDLALKDYKHIALNSSFLKAYLRKGKVLQGMEQHSTVMDICQKAIELDTNSSEALEEWKDKLPDCYCQFDPGIGDGLQGKHSYPGVSLSDTHIPLVWRILGHYDAAYTRKLAVLCITRVGAQIYDTALEVYGHMLKDHHKYNSLRQIAKSLKDNKEGSIVREPSCIEFYDRAMWDLNACLEKFQEKTCSLYSDWEPGTEPLLDEMMQTCMSLKLDYIPYPLMYCRLKSDLDNEDETVWVLGGSDSTVHIYRDHKNIHMYMEWQDKGSWESS